MALPWPALLPSVHLTFEGQDKDGSLDTDERHAIRRRFAYAPLPSACDRTDRDKSARAQLDKALRSQYDLMSKKRDRVVERRLREAQCLRQSHDGLPTTSRRQLYAAARVAFGSNRLQSMGHRCPHLCFKTVHETFDLTRLLSNLPLIMGILS